MSVLSGDHLNGLWRQTFDLSDVAAGQTDAAGLVPPLTGRVRQQKNNRRQKNISLYVTTLKTGKSGHLHICGAPEQESPSPGRCVPAGSVESVCLSEKNDNLFIHFTVVGRF